MSRPLRSVKQSLPPACFPSSLITSNDNCLPDPLTSTKATGQTHSLAAIGSSLGDVFVRQFVNVEPSQRRDNVHAPLDGLRKPGSQDPLGALSPDREPMVLSDHELRETIHAVNHYMLHNVAVHSRAYGDYVRILEKLTDALIHAPEDSVD